MSPPKSSERKILGMFHVPIYTCELEKQAVFPPDLMHAQSNAVSIPGEGKWRNNGVMASQEISRSSQMNSFGFQTWGKC